MVYKTEWHAPLYELQGEYNDGKVLKQDLEIALGAVAGVRLDPPISLRRLPGSNGPSIREHTACAVYLGVDDREKPWVLYAPGFDQLAWSDALKYLMLAASSPTGSAGCRAEAADQTPPETRIRATLMTSLRIGIDHFALCESVQPSQQPTLYSTVIVDRGPEALKLLELAATAADTRLRGTAITVTKLRWIDVLGSGVSAPKPMLCLEGHLSMDSMRPCRLYLQDEEALGAFRWVAQATLRQLDVTSTSLLFVPCASIDAGNDGCAFLARRIPYIETYQWEWRTPLRP